MERAGVAAIHIEDQVQAKRCGHRPVKQKYHTEEKYKQMQRRKVNCQ